MKKLLSLMLALVLVLGSALPVMAEKYDDPNAGSGVINHTDGTTVTFDKYLVMDKDAQVPYADFWYTVSSDGKTGNPNNNDENEEIYPDVLIGPTTAPTTTSPGADMTPVVWKGVRPDKVKVYLSTANQTEKDAASHIGEITFEPSDSTTDGAYRLNKGDIATAAEKYVKKTFVLDFTNIKFAEPGVYRYYLEESNADTYSDLGISYDVNVLSTNNRNWRTVDVYVEDDGSGNLGIAGYVWYEGKLTSNDKPSHSADSSLTESPWSVDWTDDQDTNKKYVYVSNNIWKIQTTQDGGATWYDTNPLETVKEPSLAATGNVTIDGKTYDTWSAAKDAMTEFITKTPTPNGAEAGDPATNPKSTEFVNKYNTMDLEFGKKVEGNQGSRDQWFEFRVTLINDAKDTNGNLMLTDLTEFVVNVGAYTSTNPGNAEHFFAPSKNAATSYLPEDMKNSNTKNETENGIYFRDFDNDNNPDEFTVANNLTDGNILVAKNGKVVWTLYLQHGQYVKIKGIPNGVTYTVEETDPATGYTKKDGTSVETGVIDGEELTKAHNDALTGKVGDPGIGQTDYIKDSNGDLYKDSTGVFHQLYQHPVTGKYYKTYSSGAYSDEYVSGDGERYFADTNIYTGVTNIRDGVIPTGVLMSVAGGVALIAMAGVGLILVNRKKKEYED